MYLLLSMILLINSISGSDASNNEETAISAVKADLGGIIKSEGKLNYSIASLKQAKTYTGKAYLGLLKASSASFAIWPGDKLKRFNEGKSLIEEAIRESGAQPEPRLLRLMVQCNCPVFLGYSSQIEGDRKVLMRYLEEKTGNKDLMRFIAENMLHISCVTNAEKAAIRKLIP
jgi:hypothetical protein